MKGLEAAHWRVMSPPLGVTEKPSRYQSRFEVPATPVSLKKAQASIAAPEGTDVKVAFPAAKQPGSEPAPFAAFEPSVTSATMVAGSELTNWWVCENV